MILGSWHTDIVKLVRDSDHESNETPRLGKVGQHEGVCRGLRQNAAGWSLSHDVRPSDTEQQHDSGVDKADERVALVPAPPPGILDEGLQRGDGGDPLVPVQLYIPQVLHSHRHCELSTRQQGALDHKQSAALPAAS